MSRIFISHSTANNPQALALAQWLTSEGWRDYFLDVDPAGELTPGVRWQEALKRAVHRCEAILFLISPAWTQSSWCKAEFYFAKSLGKPIFGVLVEATSLTSIPQELTSEWQLADLVSGEARVFFTVRHDPYVPETKVSFSANELLRLKRGLQKTGLDPSSFEWPPKDDPSRPPYCGLKALEARDAAIFFGREAPLIRACDRLRTMRDQDVERVLMVLGASGSGKSSFMRAGLAPRLERDDAHFVPLPCIRPQRAAITGEMGLLAALEGGFLRYGITRTRGSLAPCLEDGAAFVQLLRELQSAAGALQPAGVEPPTVVLLIDQGEELLAATQGDEASKFLELLRLLFAPADAGTQGSTRKLVQAVITLSQTSYGALQALPQMANVQSVLFNLRPLEPVEFKDVIEGPARRMIASGKPLKIDPLLTERLLEDLNVADALPLLAYVLERLYVQFGADGDLRLDEYQKLGQLQGAITAAIDAAFASPHAHPQIPADEALRSKLLRQAFIPALVEVDDVTGERRRRVARWSEIPAQSRPLIERLIEARLIARDGHESSSEATVEVAHEALLRQWPLVAGWLDAAAFEMRTLAAIRRAANEFDSSGRDASWLVHSGPRLKAAEALLEDPQLRNALGKVGIAYIDACRKRARDEQSGRVLARRLGGGLAAVVVLAVAAIWAIAVVDSRRLSMQLVSNAKEAFRSGDEDRALRFAVLAGQSSLLFPAAREVRENLAYMAANSGLQLTLTEDQKLRLAKFSDDGRSIVSVTGRNGISIWDAESGERKERLERLQGGQPIRDVAISPDGRRVAAATPVSLWLWDLADRRWRDLGVSPRGLVSALSFDKDGSALRLEGSAGVRAVDLAGGAAHVATDLLAPSRVHDARAIPGGWMVIASSGDANIRVLSVRPGASPRLVRTIRLPALPRTAALSPHTPVFAAAFADGSVRTWNWESGQEGPPLADSLLADKPFRRLVFSDDGQRLMAICECSTTPVFNIGRGGQTTLIRSLQGYFDPVFSPDSSSVLFASSDSEARVVGFNGGAGTQPVKHSTKITSAAFSPDQQRLVTTDESHVFHVWQVPRDSSEVVIESSSRTRVVDADFSTDSRSFVVSATTQGGRLKPLFLSSGIPRALAEERMASDTWTVDRISLGAGSRLTVASTERLLSRSELVADRRLLDPVYGQFDGSFSSEGRRFLVIGNRKSQVWDVGRSQPLADPVLHGDLCTPRLSADGRVLVTADRGEVSAWLAETSARYGVRMTHDSDVVSLAASANGQTVATLTSKGTLTVWQTADGTQISVHPAAETRAAHVDLSADGKRVVTTFPDGTIKVWDVRGKDLADLDFQGDDSDQLGVTRFAPDGASVVAIKGNRARVWPSTSRVPLSQELVHSDTLTRARLSGDGRFVLTISKTGSVRLWHIGEFAGRPATEIAAGVCATRLRGGRKITVEDAEIAPILRGRVGEDACRAPSTLQRLRSLWTDMGLGGHR